MILAFLAAIVLMAVVINRRGSTGASASDDLSGRAGQPDARPGYGARRADRRLGGDGGGGF